MKLSFDKEADALLIILKEGPWEHTKDMGQGIDFAFNEQGELMAISILYLSKRCGRPVLDYLNLDFAPEHEPLEIEADIEIPKAVKKR